SQSVDLARARIWRRPLAATPTISGSQWLSWLPTTRSGPLSGIESRPSTRSLPHRATGAFKAMARPYVRVRSRIGDGISTPLVGVLGSKQRPTDYESRQ